MNINDLWQMFTQSLGARQTGFMDSLQKYQPTPAPIGDGQQLVSGVRAGQIERAVQGGPIQPMQVPQGIPVAGGQGFFTQPQPGRRPLTPAEAEQIRKRFR